MSSPFSFGTASISSSSISSQSQGFSFSQQQSLSQHQGFSFSQPPSSSSSSLFGSSNPSFSSSSSSSSSIASPSFGFGSGSSPFQSFSISSSSSSSLFGSASSPAAAPAVGSSSFAPSSSTPPSSATIPNFGSASASAAHLFVFTSSSPASSNASSMFGASTTSSSPATLSPPFSLASSSSSAASISSSSTPPFSFGSSSLFSNPTPPPSVPSAPSSSLSSAPPFSFGSTSMSTIADSEFKLQDYADFCILDGLSAEDAAAVMAAMFEDDEITSSSNSIQAHNSVAPCPESASRSQFLLPADATTSKTESAAQGSEAYCAICMETKPLAELFNTNFCTHLYCNACVGSYVAGKVHDGVGWINCAGPGCEAGFLGLEACRPVLPNDLIDRWGDLLCESMIRVKFYCPYNDCSALLMGEEEDSNGARDEIITQSVCPHCHRMFCAQCRSPWHQGLKCEEVQEMGEGDRGRDDLKLKEVAESSHWMRCPECKYFVEKNEGCNHITCRCKYEFCYKCGAKWKSSHYNCTGAK